MLTKKCFYIRINSMDSSSNCELDQFCNNWLDANRSDDRDTESVEGHCEVSNTNPIFSPILPEILLPTHDPLQQLLAFQDISNSNPALAHEQDINMVPEVSLDIEVESEYNHDESDNTNNEEINASMVQALIPLLSDLCQLTKKVGRFGVKLLSMKVLDKTTFDMILQEHDSHTRVYQLYNGALNSDCGPGQLLEALLTSGNENVFKFIKASVLDPTVLMALGRIERKMATEAGTNNLSFPGNYDYQSTSSFPFSPKMSGSHAELMQKLNQSSALGFPSADPNSSSGSDVDSDLLFANVNRKRQIDFDDPLTFFPNKKPHPGDDESQRQETKPVKLNSLPARIEMKKQSRPGPPCISHKGHYGTMHACREFSEESRQRIFDAFWSGMSSDERQCYAASLIDLVPTKRRSEAGSEESRRRRSTYCLYTLELNGERKRVCQRMFTSTLAITAPAVHSWFIQQTSQRPSTSSPLSICPNPKNNESNITEQHEQTITEITDCTVQQLSSENDKETQTPADAYIIENDEADATIEREVDVPNDHAETCVSTLMTNLVNAEGHPHDSSATLLEDPASYS